jgi:aminopeptidase N
MRQMATTNQSIDLNAVDERAFRTMGVNDPASLFKPPPDPSQPPPPPPPEQITAQATLMAAQARLQDSQTKAGEARIKALTAQSTAQTQAQMIQSKEKIASLGVARELVIHNSDKELARQQLQSEDTHRSADRMAGLVQAHMNNQAGLAQADMGHSAGLAKARFAHAAGVHQKGLELRQNLIQQGVDHQSSLVAQGVKQAHEGAQSERDRQYDLFSAREKNKGLAKKD